MLISSTEAPRYAPAALPGPPHNHRNVAAVHPARRRARYRRPLVAAHVAAGFPSPADDFVDRALDLNELCIRHPPATFFVRGKGESLTNAGIDDGDLLVVDRALDARPGDVVIAVVGGEMTVKRYVRRGGLPMLVAEHDEYPAIVPGEDGFQVWGVVTFCFKALRR